MNIENLLDAFDIKHLFHPYTNTIKPNYAFKVESADGCNLNLCDGTSLVDGTSSWWCAALGYNHPRLNQALTTQLQKMAHVMFGGLTHDSAINLGKKLLEYLPKSLDKIFYVESGSVAIEVALKMAMQYQIAKGHANKTNFATLTLGYHGDTFNAMSICDPIGGMHTIFKSVLPIRYFVPSPTSCFEDNFNTQDLDKVSELFEKESTNIAAFILEPIMQGASAMRFYHPLFLKGLQELCKKYDILLIVDEIATGFYRLGKKFASDYAQIVPDIMTIGKGLSAGYIPLAACVCSDDVAFTISSHKPYAFMHGPTYMANPLACAVAHEALTIYQEQDMESIILNIQNILTDRLSIIKNHPFVKDVRVLGAVGVIETHDNINVNLIEPMFIKHKVWLRPFANLIYTMPPFIISNNELNQLATAMIEVCDEYYHKMSK